MKTTSIQIDRDLHTEYKTYCKQYGFSMQGLVEVLIKQQINDSKKENESTKSRINSV
jgi:antitoxin component of RelBE/YafQ-DinJ toxin-antitoxin module